MVKKNDKNNKKSITHPENTDSKNHSVKSTRKNIIENILSFELSGHSCKLVALKNNKPRPDVIEMTEGCRQYRYVEDEIVHFCLDGCWFAVCKDNCMSDMQVSHPIESEKIDRKPLFNLTERELQIVQLVCLGLLTKQIAAHLVISEFTVNTYIKGIFNKLGVRSRAAMVYKFTELSKHVLTPVEN